MRNYNPTETLVGLLPGQDSSDGGYWSGVGGAGVVR